VRCRHTAYVILVHTLRFIDSFTIPSRLRSASWRVSASLCVVIIYLIRARKTAPRSHRVINRDKRYWRLRTSPRNILRAFPIRWHYFIPEEFFKKYIKNFDKKMNKLELVSWIYRNELFATWNLARLRTIYSIWSKEDWNSLAREVSWHCIPFMYSWRKK